MSQSQMDAGGLSRLQSVVDQLAEELGRSVEVDNPSFEVLSTSAQIGPIDQRRISSIIDRTPPPEPLPWLLGFGIQQATAPVRIPANPQYGMLPRVCFPVRRGTELCGYLWLIDEPPVSAAEIERTLLAVRDLSRLAKRVDEDLQERAAQLARRTAAVLAGAPGGLEEARREGLLPHDGQVALHLLRLEEDAEPEAESDPPARRLQLELSRMRRLRPVLPGWDHGQVYVLEASRTEAERARALDDVRAARMLSRVRAKGIGSVELDQATLPIALRRAHFLAELAELLGRGSEALTWQQAGGWRLLQGWPQTAASVAAISPDAERLLQAGSTGHWATVLAWLEHGRGTNATSEELFVHRATLHYRLSRAREVLGPEVLDDGWRSTALHAALKLHQALQAPRTADAPRGIT
ncbi:helix-turn-helix domain-containing protein [Luteococcus peritonei]|uniref:PucR family transcriptional regulator n=1 Tax=Luteococcus peritonei TaxID=88874 RepID=A0ABW4RU81_9ACTN